MLYIQLHSTATATTLKLIIKGFILGKIRPLVPDSFSLLDNG